MSVITMRWVRMLALPLVAGSLAACDAPKQNKTVDNWVDSKPLTRLKAGIWVDPDGCHTWIIDDGAEGYMSRRYDPRTGLPVCTPIAPPGSIVGDPYGRRAACAGHPPLSQPPARIGPRDLSRGPAICHALMKLSRWCLRHGPAIGTL
jgi:hypothetical protein